VAHPENHLDFVVRRAARSARSNEVQHAPRVCIGVWFRTDGRIDRSALAVVPK
jgi:hypothetical protein